MFLRPGMKCVIEVAQDNRHSKEPFSEDWLVLRIMHTNGALLASKYFNSTYQTFRIDLIDLDGDGQKEFVFTLGHGRGTSARQETLTIERLVGSRFEIILTTPFSDFYASGKRWFYRAEFKPSSEGITTDLLLKLHTDDGLPAGGTNSAIPAEQSKVFKWRRADLGDRKTPFRQVEVEFEPRKQKVLKE